MFDKFLAWLRGPDAPVSSPLAETIPEVFYDQPVSPIRHEYIQKPVIAKGNLDGEDLLKFM